MRLEAISLCFTLDSDPRYLSFTLWHFHFLPTLIRDTKNKTFAEACYPFVFFSNHS